MSSSFSSSSSSLSSSSTASRKSKDVPPMHPLMRAALDGNVKFLKESVASKRLNYEYFLTIFKQNEHKSKHCGNIFHLAALKNKTDFIREAIEILPLRVKQRLLLQPQDGSKENPLHIAAERGRLEIVKLFLDVYKVSPPFPSDLSKRPWLQKSSEGENPCHTALSNHKQECALEIWKMDPELISIDVCGKDDEDRCGVLYTAIDRGLGDFALEILRSPHTMTYKGQRDNTPLHRVYELESPEKGAEILKLLLKNQPEQIKQKNAEGETVLHVWAESCQLWPFECLLDSSDIIKNVTKIFVELIDATTHKEGDNPLHTLAKSSEGNDEVNKIAQKLIDTYKKEAARNKSDTSEDMLPWLVQNKEEDTPLSLALESKDDKLAIYILSVDKNALKNSQNALFMAVENDCQETVYKILEIVKTEKQKWSHLLVNDENLTALHLAPKCKEDTFFKQILEVCPELLGEYDGDGNSVLMTWVKENDIRAVEYIWKSRNRRYISLLADLIDDTDDAGNNPFHAATKSSNAEVGEQIVKLLVQVYQRENSDWNDELHSLPWNETNYDNKAPLHLAIGNKREDVAMYLLSLSKRTNDGGEVKKDIHELLDLYEPKQHKIIFLAIKNNCYRVATEILDRLDKKKWKKYLKNSSNNCNILHLAARNRTMKANQDFWTKIVNEVPDFILQNVQHGKTPLEEACDVGAAWFITAVLKAKPTAISSSTSAWINACEKGHVEAIRAFIEFDMGAFRDICFRICDTPLHHLHGQNLTKYEEILNLPLMKYLINLQDSNKETALHKAIRRKDKFLTEALLNIDKVRHDIKDYEEKTAIDLLKKEYNDDPDWELVCNIIGFDPELKTSYFERGTNLLDVRSSLFVVAALLATITFTAGFTLPGGLDQNTGEAMMAKRVSFAVFLISNSVGMCSSMLVLVCLVFSMVHQTRNKELLWTERSMVFLKIALYTTILAFMTGVYLVVSRRTFWLAIVVIVMCSLMGISANRNIFSMFLLFPRKRENKHKHSIHRLEQGDTAKEEQDPLLHEQNLNQGRQAASQSNDDSDEEESSLDEKNLNQGRQSASQSNENSDEDERSLDEQHSNQGRQSSSQSNENSDEEDLSLDEQHPNQGRQSAK